MRFGLLLLIATAFLPGVVRAEGPIVSFTLKNGLRVAMEEDHRTPRVAVRVGYAVGWRDGPPGCRGLPHLYEHLMFVGSRHAPGDSFWRLLEEAGATDIDAITGPDETAYQEIVPSHQLALALWLESDRMAFLLDALNQKQVEEQKKVVLQENDCGKLEEVHAITLGDVEWFGQHWYRPDRAVLSLVGDFDPVEVRDIVERYFGPIVAAPPAPNQVTPAPKAEEVVENVTRQSVRLVWSSSPAFTSEDAAFDVLAHVLEHRLVETLERQLAVSSKVDVEQRSRAVSSEFVVEATVARGATPERILQLIDEELDRLRRSTIGPAELSRAAHTFPYPSMLERAAAMAAYWRAWGTPDGGEREARRYKDVTSEDVQRAAVKLGSPR